MKRPEGLLEFGINGAFAGGVGFATDSSPELVAGMAALSTAGLLLRLSATSDTAAAAPGEERSEETLVGKSLDSWGLVLFVTVARGWCPLGIPSANG